MSADQSQSYSADGGDEGTVVAFETIKNIPCYQEFGVSVTGRTCGVHGASGPFETRDAPRAGTGVFGRGSKVGVYGHGATGVTAQGGTKGLLATAQGGGPEDSEPVDPARPFFEGRTVVTAILAVHDQTEGNVVSSSTAVRAEANGSDKKVSGCGVVALSEFNRAGVFVTGEQPKGGTGKLSLTEKLLLLKPDKVVAQVHLVPIEGSDTPSPKGQAGDLIALSYSSATETTLWFCQKSFIPGIPGKPGTPATPDIPAVWKRLDI